MELEWMQAVILLIIAATGLIVVRTREPMAQVIVFSFYGTLLAVMFVLFQAPDVGFSQITVGAVVLPLLITLAIVRTRRRAR